MKSRAGQIGFSQRVRLEWLEHAANLAAAGVEKTELEERLQELLREKLSVGGESARGNREKAITILLKTWVRVPEGIEALRDEGLALFRRIPQPEHVALHWGLAMAVYPFLGATAASVGRLLRLQGTVAAAQVQRRLRETHGERETVSRAARRVLRSFVDWGVLEDSAGLGVYRLPRTLEVGDGALTAWLLVACLHARGGHKAPLKDLCASPMLFPFRLDAPNLSGLPFTEGTAEVIRHDFDEDLLGLRALDRQEAERKRP